MKYIISKGNRVKIFPESVSHSQMGTKKNVRSAGYFKVRNGKVETYAKSYSLDIPSKKSDAKLIENKLSNANY